MKNNEFKNFLTIAQNDGMMSDFVQCSGWAWLALTDRQLQTVRKLAIEQGFEPDADGKVTVGAWTISDDVTETVNNFMNKENTEMKTENETPVVEETAAPVEDNANVPALVEIDEKKVNAAIARVEKKVAGIEKGYLGIIGDVAYLHETKAHKVTGHKDFYALCADRFHMSRGSVSNILNVYERFGDGNYHLADENKDRSLRSMLEEIKNEKTARKGLENNVGVSVVDEDENEDATNGSKSRKRETIVDFDFTNADAWSLEDLMDKIREELESANIGEIAANANIIFKVIV